MSFFAAAKLSYMCRPSLVHQYMYAILSKFESISNESADDVRYCNYVVVFAAIDAGVFVDVSFDVTKQHRYEIVRNVRIPIVSSLCSET